MSSLTPSIPQAGERPVGPNPFPEKSFQNHIQSCLKNGQGWRIHPGGWEIVLVANDSHCSQLTPSFQSEFVQSQLPAIGWCQTIPCKIEKPIIKYLFPIVMEWGFSIIFCMTSVCASVSPVWCMVSKVVGKGYSLSAEIQG